MEQIKHIRLDKLIPPKFDHRITTSPEEDQELMESIRELGLFTPLIVKDTEDGYEIIAGYRRFKAAGIAGLAAVPCIVVKTDDAASEKIKLHENIKRLPLSHIDQAYTFAHLRIPLKLTEQQISILVGKSISYVSQHLALLSCSEVMVSAVHSGQINFSVARELSQCKDSDEQERLMNIVVDHGASTAVVQSWVRESNKESAIIRGEAGPQKEYKLPDAPPTPMYPCLACEIPTNLLELKIARLCDSCFNSIFDEIEREKIFRRNDTLKNIPQITP